MEMLNRSAVQGLAFEDAMSWLHEMRSRFGCWAITPMIESTVATDVSMTQNHRSSRSSPLAAILISVSRFPLAIHGSNPKEGETHIEWAAASRPHKSATTTHETVTPRQSRKKKGRKFGISGLVKQGGFTSGRRGIKRIPSFDDDQQEPFVSKT